MTASGGSGHDAVVGSTMARIARSGAANLVGTGISTALTFLLILLIARVYPAQQAGAFFALTSVFLILLALVEAGADQALVRAIARARARGETEYVPTVLRTGVLGVLAAASVAAVIGVIAAEPLAELMVGAELVPLVSGALRVLAITLPVAACYELLLAATRGYGLFRPTIVIERLVRPALQPVAAIAVAVAGGELTALAMAWAAPYLAGLVAAAVALRRIRKTRAPGGAGRDPELTAAEAAATRSGFWRYALPIGMVRVCQVTLQRADIVLIAALIGPKEAAIYTAVTRFLVVGQLALQAVQQVIQPWLVTLLAIHDHTVTSTVFKRITAWFVALAWPMYLVCAVFAEDLARVFGPAYVAGASSLVLLSLAMLLATAMGPLDVLLQMSGRSGTSMINAFVAVFVDVGLCVLLIPDYGMIAAAAARVAAVWTRNLLTVIQVRRQLDIRAGSRALAQVCILAAAWFGLLGLILDEVLGGPVAIALTICVGGLGYLASMWLLRDSLGLTALAAIRRRSSALAHAR
jgi:O-antigen/teichoic acid export membrane protein